MKQIHAIFYAAFVLLLAACEIEGGVPRTATSLAPPPPTATAPPAASPVQPTPTAPQDLGFRIGLLDEPADLLPYYSDMTDQRATAAVSELLFPSPLLATSSGYTTTGVLQRVPSFANGDIEQRIVEAFLDSTGAITTTATDVVTQVQQLVITYHWNTELRWSDGTPVTADDSVFAYELAQQVSLGDDAANRLALIERYERVDAHTTRAVLKPDFTDPSYLQTFWTPLPRHLLQTTPPAEITRGDFAVRPVGYGPYMIDRREQGSLRMKRNPYAAGPPPGADQVLFIFRDSVDALRGAVLGGSLDVATTDRLAPEQLQLFARDEANELLQISYVAGPIWEHLDFNLDVPLFQDIRVRRAIALGTNRQLMAETLLGGKVPVLESWVMPWQWAAAPADQLTRYPYDPEQARKLLDEASLLDSDGDGKRELNGEPLTVRLLTSDSTPLRESMAGQFKSDMAALGIQVEVQLLPASQLYSPTGPLFRREFELALFAWIAGPDPGGLGLWSCAAVPSPTNGWIGDNFPGWCFREADQAIRTANTSLDREERRAAYLRQQQLFTQELPVLPLFQRPVLIFSNPQVQGLRPDPIAPITWNLVQWTRT